MLKCALTLAPKCIYDMDKPGRKRRSEIRSLRACALRQPGNRTQHGGSVCSLD